MDAHDLTDETPQVSPPDLENEQATETADLEDTLSSDDALHRARVAIDRLAALDPAEVVEPAAAIAETLGRLLEEEER